VHFHWPLKNPSFDQSCLRVGSWAYLELSQLRSSGQPAKLTKLCQVVLSPFHLCVAIPWMSRSQEQSDFGNWNCRQRSLVVFQTPMPEAPIRLSCLCGPHSVHLSCVDCFIGCSRQDYFSWCLHLQGLDRTWLTFLSCLCIRWRQEGRHSSCIVQSTGWTGSFSAATEDWSLHHRHGF